MQPPKGHMWLPKTESEKPSSSSKSTQNVPSRISRAITRAVSNILPSSSSRQSNRTTGNPLPSSNRPYNSVTGSTPASGLSSILSRRVACAPTSPDALLHPHQLTPDTTNVTGATSSQVTDRQRSVHKETMPNPILRTNLLTSTPTFNDAGVTAPQGKRNYSRKPAISTGTSSSTNPASRNPIPAGNYSRKDKRGTSLRSARKSAAPSPISGNSKPAIGTSGGIISRTGPISRPTPIIINSAVKVSGGGSSRATGHSKLVNFTSDQQHPPNTVHRVSANKELVNNSACDPKGKGVATFGDEATKRKALDTYRNYEQWIKDHYISSSDLDQPGCGPIPLGEKCQLCAIDLAFMACNSNSGSSTDPPVSAILPCGHTFHASCLEQVYGSSLEPHCLSCGSGSLEGVV